MGLARSKGNLEIAKQENSVILLEKDYKQSYKGFNPKNPETLIGLKILQEDYLDRCTYLASKIERNFKNKLHRKSRGIKQTPLWVLDAAYMPSVLIELGFLSNSDEGIYLNLEDGQNNMAEAIASAIIDYKKVYFETHSNDNNDDLASNNILITEIKDSSKNFKSKRITEKQVLQKRDLKTQKSGVVFKVQFAAGNKNIKLNPSNFKGLKNVSMTTSGGSFFRYTYGLTADYHAAKEDFKVVKTKG
jgi:N-acetylmuramoyl-L-alanine amidase